MNTRNIATSTVWQLSSQAITMVLGILSIKLVTTGLSQSLVGNYQTVYSYLQIFGILADFGLYAVSVRELSRTENRSLTFGSLFVLRACITLLSLGTAVIVAWVIPSFSDTPLSLGIAVAVFVPFFTLLGGMLRTLFQVEYRMHFVFAAEVAGKALPVLLIAAAVVMGARQSESVELYYRFLAYGGMGSLLFFLLSLYFARGLLTLRPALSGLRHPSTWLRAGGYGRPAVAEFKRLFSLAAPFGLAFLMTTIYRQSDVTLIALLRDDYDIQNAYYGVVLRLAEIGFLVPTFLLNSALPKMSEGEAAGRDMSNFLGQVLLALLTLGSVIAIFSFFWAKPLILLLTQESYLATPLSPGSDTALQLLSFSIFLGVLVSYFFYVLLNRGQWKTLLGATGIAAVVSVVVNLQVIPLFGFLGASITSIAVHVLLALLLTIAALRSTKVILRFSQFARWFVCSLAIAFLAWLSTPLLVGTLPTLVLGGLVVSVCGVLILCCGLLPTQALWATRQRRV